MKDGLPTQQNPHERDLKKSQPAKPIAAMKICLINREVKHDVYGRRQTAKITSDFLFFSCNPQINHAKIEKCLLLFTANTNILILLYRELKTDGKSIIFAVCRKRHA